MSEVSINETPFDERFFYYYDRTEQNKTPKQNKKQTNMDVAASLFAE